MLATVSYLIPDGSPKTLAFANPFYPNPQPGATPNFFVRKEIEGCVANLDGVRSNQGCRPARRVFPSSVQRLLQLPKLATWKR